MNKHDNPDPGFTPRIKRILLVEDEPMSRLHLLESLRRSGLDVEVANNGRIALEKVRANPPDAIFMDLLIPAMRGVDLIKEARQNSAFGDRPIFVCTSAARLDAWSQRGTKAGATKVFDRAVTPVDVIVAQVAAALGVVPPCAQAPTAPPSEVPPSEVPPKSGQFGPPLSVVASFSEAGTVAKPDARPPLFKRVLQSLKIAKPAEQNQWAPQLSPQVPPQLSPPVPPRAHAEPPCAVQVPPIEGPSVRPAQPTIDLRPPSIQPEGFGMPPADQAAIIYFDGAGTIVSGNEGCLAMFGWAGSELVGQNLATLVREGMDLEVREFVQQRLQGNSCDGKQSLSVIGRRKDGTEFSATVRTVIWSTETNFTQKSEASHLSFTAVFRQEVKQESPAPVCDPPQAEPGAAPSAEAPAGDPNASVRLMQMQKAHAELQAAYETVRHQLNDVAAEAASLREAQAQQYHESGDSLQRLTAFESELNQARTALEQERGERERLQTRSEELTAALATAESRSKDQPATGPSSDQESPRLARDLEEAKAALGRTEEALKQRAATCERLEAELGELRQQIQILNARPATPPGEIGVGVGDVCRRAENLESKSDTNGEAAIHRDLDAELCAAKAAAQVAEACLREEVERAQSFEERLDRLCNNLKQEQSERGKRFEEELARYQGERQTLKEQLATAEAAANATKQQAAELEQRLADNSADLAHISAELGNRTAEHKRSEGEWRKQLEKAEAQTKKLKAALHEAESKAASLQQELTTLQQSRADLNARLTAEQQAAAEVQFRVDDLEERLLKNSAELEQVKTERDSAIGGQKSSEMDMANLYHMRNLLGSKLEIEQRVAAESTKRSQALEEQLRDNSAELERVKQAYDKNSRDKAQLENRLQARLAAAKTAAVEAEAGLKQKLAECGRLQTDLANLQQARDDFRVQLTRAQQAAAEASRDNAQLEELLRQSAEELDQAKSNQLRQAEEQKRIEAELQAQLAAAQAATERAEASRQEESQRNQAFEQRLLLLGNTLKNEEMERTNRMQAELDSVRQARDELAQKHGSTQQEVEQTKRQVEQLNQQLQASAQQLERVKADHANQAQAHARAQSELQASLQATKSAVEKSEAALKEKTQAHGQLQAELQKARTELGGELATSKRAATEAQKQVESLTQQFQARGQELNRVKADQANQAQEQTRVQSEMTAHLQATKAAVEKSEAALKEKTRAHAQLKAELQKARTELGGDLATSKQAATEAQKQVQSLTQQFQASGQELNRVKADQASQAQEHTRVQSEMTAKLQATKAAVEKSEAALKEKTQAHGQLQAELQKARTELGGELATSKQAAAEAQKQAQGLTQRLQASTQELERVKADQANRVQELTRAQSEITAKLQATKATAEKSEAALKEKTKQISQLEATVATLQEERRDRVTNQQQALAKAKRQYKDLEKEKLDQVNELAKLQATVEEHKAAREKLAAQLQERETEATTRAGLESQNQTLSEAQATLSAELCLLRQGQGSLDAHLAESQRKVQESTARLDRATADLEKERGERRRAEHRVDSLTGQLQELHGQIKAHLDSGVEVHNRVAELERHLRDSEAQLGCVHDDLQKERTDRQLVEQQLKAADALSGQLRNCLTSFDVAKDGFKRAQLQLETKLKAAQDAVKERDEKLQKEIADRLRQEQALAEAKRAVQEQSHSVTAEVSKLAAELEEERLERKRIEGDILQSHYASFDSARAGLSMVNRLRSQVREPVDGLMQSTRLLLESELDDEPRKLVESVLEKALLVQRTLQEAGTLGACSARSARPDDLSSADPDKARSSAPTSAPPGERQP